MEKVNEIKRMQQLAGIILEVNSQENAMPEKSEEDVEKALSSASDSMLSAITSIPKGSLENAGEENSEKEPLNEELVSLVISTILATPKFLEWIGKAVGWISKKLGGKATGKSWGKAGKKLEKKYIYIIIKLLEWTGFLKTYWTDKVFSKSKRNATLVKNDQKLLIAAKTIYGVILGVAAVAAGYGAATSGVAGHAALAGLEAGLFGVKIHDIHHIHSKLKGQLGGLEADTHMRSSQENWPTHYTMDKFGYGNS